MNLHLFQRWKLLFCWLEFHILPCSEDLTLYKKVPEDYQELCEDLLLFRANWGIEIGFIFKNSEEIKGRELGVGITEEIFDAQKKIQEFRATKYESKKP